MPAETVQGASHTSRDFSGAFPSPSEQLGNHERSNRQMLPALFVVLLPSKGRCYEVCLVLLE